MPFAGRSSTRPRQSGVASATASRSASGDDMAVGPRRSATVNFDTGTAAGRFEATKHFARSEGRLQSSGPPVTASNSVPLQGFARKEKRRSTVQSDPAWAEYSLPDDFSEFGDFPDDLDITRGNGIPAASFRSPDAEYQEVTYISEPDGRMRAWQRYRRRDNEVWRKLRSSCITCDEHCLDIVTSVIVCANAITMGIEIDHPWHGFMYVEQMMLTVFIVDVILRVRWCGLIGYMKDKMHWLDLVIVMASTTELWIAPALKVLLVDTEGNGNRKVAEVLANVTLSLRFFRLVRVVRLIKVVQVAKPLYRLLVSIGNAFGKVCWVMVLIFICLYAFSIVFTQLLGQDIFNALQDSDALRMRFRTLPRTFFELFRAMCGDVTDFGPVLSAEGEHFLVPASYVLFQMCTSWLLLSIFTAVVVDTTMAVTLHEEKEQVVEMAIEARTWQREELVQGLTGIMQSVTQPDTDIVVYSKLHRFLDDEENVDKVQAVVKLSPSQILNVWEYSHYDGHVTVENFIEGLLLAAHHTVDDSMLRMESQILALDKRIYQLVRQLTVKVMDTMDQLETHATENHEMVPDRLVTREEGTKSCPLLECEGTSKPEEIETRTTDVPDDSSSPELDSLSHSAPLLTGWKTPEDKSSTEEEHDGYSSNCTGNKTPTRSRRFQVLPTLHEHKEIVHKEESAENTENMEFSTVKVELTEVRKEVRAMHSDITNIMRMLQPMAMNLAPFAGLKELPTSPITPLVPPGTPHQAELPKIAIPSKEASNFDLGDYSSSDEQGASPHLESRPTLAHEVSFGQQGGAQFAIQREGPVPRLNLKSETPRAATNEDDNSWVGALENSPATPQHLRVLSGHGSQRDGSLGPETPTEKVAAWDPLAANTSLSVAPS